jgi:beta-mannosidase
MRKKEELTWSLGYTKAEEVLPEERVLAQVPGNVQLDWAKTHNYTPYYYADNYKDYLWMEDVYWSYETELNIVDIKENEQLFFVCNGVDYSFKVKLNGETLIEQEGMFTPFEINLTNKVKKGDKLEILILPITMISLNGYGRDQAAQICKPAVSYGWDWHPRLIPSGIWDETYLEIREKSFIKEAEVQYSLSEDFLKADIELYLCSTAMPGEYFEWSLLDRTGALVFNKQFEVSSETQSIKETVENPQLWWPNGQGETYLYTSKVQLKGKNSELLDEKVKNVGFRRAKLVMHPGAWHHPDGFPKGRSNPPITMEINGRQIFCKGTNWVNPEIFPGIMNEDTYKPLLTLAKDANMNMLRVWGGGIVNKEIFFELCDKMGLMVWQEFPLACNNYKGTEKYLKVLDQESKSIIKRLRQHASVVLWCGGNELFNGWSRMTDQSLALRLLNRNCYDLDPNTPFIMTSPLEGMAHGNYIFKYHNGEEVYQAMARSQNTAYTEFGCPSPSSVDYLKTFIPEEELFPPKPGTAWETHHAFGAWVGNTWLCTEIIEDYFGESDTLEELVKKGQLLQCEGYKCIFEESRRQKPVCSMALNWCYNEPWPSAANNSIINWPAIPKPSYNAVKNSLRPVLASAKLSKYKWKPGESFDPQLWILNDDYVQIPGGKVTVYLQISNEKFKLLQWEYPELAPNTNFEGPVIKFKVPDVKGSMTMNLILEVEGDSSLNSEYILAYENIESEKHGPKVGTLNI